MALTWPSSGDGMFFHLSGESGTIEPPSSSLPHLGTLSRIRAKYQHSEESHTLFYKKGGFGLDPVIVGRGKKIQRNLPRHNS